MAEAVAVKQGTPAAVQQATAVQQERQKKPARAAPRKRAAKKTNQVFADSKRKTSVARASAGSGKGKITINQKSVDLVKPWELREIMLEALNVSARAKEIAAKLDISVNVSGGGVSSQAQAVRGAIARCIAKSDPTDSVKRELLAYDRSMLVDDFRRVEPKKFLGPKARARFQTSYR
jgi:small subunit ribosomal protein S9